VELIVVVFDVIGVPTAEALNVEGSILDLRMETETIVEPADDRKTAGAGGKSGLDLYLKGKRGGHGELAIVDVDNILGAGAVGKEQLAVGDGLSFAIGFGDALAVIQQIRNGTVELLDVEPIGDLGDYGGTILGLHPAFLGGLDLDAVSAEGSLGGSEGQTAFGAGLGGKGYGGEQNAVHPQLAAVIDDVEAINVPIGVGSVSNLLLSAILQDNEFGLGDLQIDGVSFGVKDD
jgi:hypothetical protein